MHRKGVKNEKLVLKENKKTENPKKMQKEIILGEKVRIWNNFFESVDGIDGGCPNSIEEEDKNKGADCNTENKPNIKKRSFCTAGKYL